MSTAHYTQVYTHVDDWPLFCMARAMLHSAHESTRMHPKKNIACAHRLNRNQIPTVEKKADANGRNIKKTDANGRNIKKKQMPTVEI